ncbi:MAG: Os1348 family NHLP clan protein [Thermoanaerobaculia bacterium]
MSQKNVELIIGKLATDEEFRRGYCEDPARTVLALVDRGVELTTCERNALGSMDPRFLEKFAESLDPRIQKACLKSLPPERKPC